MATGGACAGRAGANDRSRTAQAQAFVDSLQFRDGDIAIPGANAHLRTRSRFPLPRARTMHVACWKHLWGNPPDTSVLGMVVPRRTPPLLDEGLVGRRARPFQRGRLCFRRGCQHHRLRRHADPDAGIATAESQRVPHAGRLPGNPAGRAGPSRPTTTPANKKLLWAQGTLVRRWQR